MTRSHKFNDRVHSGEAASPDEHLPKFFGKNGFADADPKKTKKNGSGKGNWGSVGEEIVDDESFNFVNPRRRSNSSTMTNDINNFKTKFDINEQEPVFEEDLHGPLDEELDSSSVGSVDTKST